MSRLDDYEIGKDCKPLFWKNSNPSRMASVGKHQIIRQQVNEALPVDTHHIRNCKGVEREVTRKRKYEQEEWERVSDATILVFQRKG